MAPQASLAAALRKLKEADQLQYEAEQHLAKAFEAGAPAYLYGEEARQYMAALRRARSAWDRLDKALRDIPPEIEEALGYLE